MIKPLLSYLASRCHVPWQSGESLSKAQILSLLLKMSEFTFVQQLSAINQQSNLTNEVAEPAPVLYGVQVTKISTRCLPSHTAKELVRTTSCSHRITSYTLVSRLLISLLYEGSTLSRHASHLQDFLLILQFSSSPVVSSIYHCATPTFTTMITSSEAMLYQPILNYSTVPKQSGI